MALRQVDKRQLNSGLKGLGLNLSDSQLGSIAKLGGSEALRNLVDIGKRVSRNSTPTRAPPAAGRRFSNEESTKEAEVFTNYHRHKIPGRTVNEENAADPSSAKPSKPVRRLRSSIVSHVEHEPGAARAGVRTAYGERKAVDKHIRRRVANCSEEMNSVFHSQFQVASPTSAGGANDDMAPGDVDQPHGVHVSGRSGDRHRKWKRHTSSAVSARRKVLERLRATGSDTRDVFFRFDRGQSGEVSVSDFLSGVKKVGVQLGNADVENLVDAVDPDNTGIVSFAAFAQVLDGVDSAYNPNNRALATKARHGRRQSHLMSNKPKIERMRSAKLMAAVEQKLGVRFGTGTDRLRRLYISLERNGDGTVSKANLRKGLTRVGIDLDDRQYQTFLGQVDAANQGKPRPNPDDVYYTDLLSAFEAPQSGISSKTSAQPTKETGRMRTKIPSGYRKNWDDLDLSDDAYKKGRSATIPDHVPSSQRNRDSLDLAAHGAKGRLRPRPLTQEERKVRQVKRLVRDKLYERGKSTTAAFLELDSDRDGIVTAEDIRSGMMHRLGLPLRQDQVELLAAALGRGETGDGAMVQEFVAAFEDLDGGRHGYTNDRAGSGGGGEGEGPVAAAVGKDVVVQWGGAREHRGQLSSSLTASGTTSMGPQYTKGAAEGAASGAQTARQAAAARAAREAPTIKQRRAKRLIETISDRITQKREDIRKMFIKMDSHKHGSLSYKEFREGLDAAGVHLSDDDFSIVAREVDPVGDGRIEFVEFARAVKRDQRKASDATVSPQKTNVALRDGRPVRVGLCTTDTPRNHSDEVHELMRMPPIDGIKPMNEESFKDEDVFEKMGHVHLTSYGDISTVATRLKISDALASRVGPSLRQQYVSLERHGGGALKASQLFSALTQKGVDISRPELEKLMDSSGVRVDAESPGETPISFDDYKRMSYESGLGEDSREYDFVRAVQLTAGVGVTSGSIQQKSATEKGTWHVEAHRVKHLHESAGMLEKVASKKPNRLTRRDKNVESGVGETIMTPSRLHVDGGRGAGRTPQAVVGHRKENAAEERQRAKAIRRRDKNAQSGGGRKTVLNATPKSGGYKVLKFRAPPPPSPYAKGAGARPPPPPPSAQSSSLSTPRRIAASPAPARSAPARFTPRQQESNIFSNLSYPV